MIFNALYESALRNELILIEGGFCRWHLKQNGQIIIYEIISTKPGAGSHMLSILKNIKGAKSISAKCPDYLPQANAWYEKKGFILIDQSLTKDGKVINLWNYLIEE